ncbi:MAG: signal recognition particle-docking protein FtsY [Clostridia bacterium]|nr:signal recognition particle-docking protein FtsY [Clostridia bacterium]
MGFFEKIKQGLKKTRENISHKIDLVINSFTKIDEEFFEELEEILIASDISFQTSQKICEDLRSEVKKHGYKDPKDIKIALRDMVEEIMSGNNDISLSTKPSVILVLGVNGVGKTTSIGKIAYDFEKSGKKVLLAAADTFRAAAVEQLEIWANRANCAIVKQPEGSDPAAVVFDAISSAKAKNIDVIICDTAGRLHNKKNLMSELEKINRIIDRELPNASKEILLVLDSTTGQNGINQALEFKKILNLTGIILTKLDGTAKGGVAVSIKQELDLPIKYIGIGEGEEDLRPFNAREFANAILGKDGDINE